MRQMRGMILRLVPLLCLLPMVAGCAGIGLGFSEKGKYGVDYLLTVTPTEEPSNVPVVSMDVGSFQGNSVVEVPAGTTITFTMPVTGGEHILVTGDTGRYKAQAGAPDTLNNAKGVTFVGGDTKGIVFANPGTYTITCTLHPSMVVKIIITPNA